MLITCQSLINCSVWTAKSWLLCSSPYAGDTLTSRIVLPDGQPTCEPATGPGWWCSRHTPHNSKKFVLFALQHHVHFSQGLDSQGCHQSTPLALASQSPALSDILISVIKPLGISSFVFMGMIKWQLFSSRPPCGANCWLGSKHAANWADLVCERLMLLAKSHKQKMCWSSLLCSSDFRQFLVPGGKQGWTVFSKPWVTCPRWLGLWYPYHTKVK